MAVVQISKIQVRRGLKSQTNIPTLSAGEFAWAIDAQELYIGNGAVSEGAPAIGNTQILTLNDASNIFNLANTYQYKNGALQTGPSANSPVRRTLQSKLDDSVSLTDFLDEDSIANNNCTVALQRAIDQLYLVDGSRQALRIPEGTYIVTGTIYVPSYATIVGEGADKTIIKQAGTDLPVFHTCGTNSTPGNPRYNVVGGTSTNPISSPNYPTNIKIQGLTVTFAAEGNQIAPLLTKGLINIDCAKDIILDDVKVLGAKSVPTNDNQIGIFIYGEGGAGALNTERLTIKNCRFEKLRTGILSDTDNSNISVLESHFSNLGRGIAFNERLTGSTGSQVGVNAVNIKDNLFADLYNEAVIIAGVSVYNINITSVDSAVVSENNIYNNCGNGGPLSDESNQFTNVIKFGTRLNRSTNDIFSREYYNLDASNSPGLYIPAVDGDAYLGKDTAVTKTFDALSFLQPLMVIPNTANAGQIVINYSASQVGLGNSRVGQVQVLTGANTATVFDNYQYNGSAIISNVKFEADLDITTNAVTVYVNNPSPGSTTTNITYQFNHLF